MTASETPEAVRLREARVAVARARIALNEMLARGETLLRATERTLEEAKRAYLLARAERTCKVPPTVGVRVRWEGPDGALCDEPMLGVVEESTPPWDPAVRIAVRWDQTGTLGAPPWRELEVIEPVGAEERP